MPKYSRPQDGSMGYMIKCKRCGFLVNSEEPLCPRCETPNGAYQNGEGSQKKDSPSPKESPKFWELALQPFKKYADFSGRAQRMEFWGFSLFVFLMNLGFACLFGLLFWLSASHSIDAKVGSGAILVLQALALTFGLGIFIPHLAVSVRRLHDVGRSGLWLVPQVIFGLLLSIPGCRSASLFLLLGLLLITLFFAITLLVFFCLNGNKGPNEYGEDPKEA